MTRLRVANAPYLRVDLLGRVGLNIYRTADPCNRVRLVDDASGLWVQLGRVGAYLRWRAAR